MNIKNFILNDLNSLNDKKLLGGIVGCWIFGFWVFIASIYEGISIIGILVFLITGVICSYFYFRLKKDMRLTSINLYLMVVCLSLGLQFLYLATMLFHRSDDSHLTFIMVLIPLVVIIISTLLYIFAIKQRIAKNRYKDNKSATNLSEYIFGSIGGGFSYFIVRIVFYKYPEIFQSRVLQSLIELIGSCVAINISSLYFYKYILQKKYGIDQIVKFEDLK